MGSENFSDTSVFIFLSSPSPSLTNLAPMSSKSNRKRKRNKRNKRTNEEDMHHTSHLLLTAIYQRVLSLHTRLDNLEKYSIKRSRVSEEVVATELTSPPHVKFVCCLFSSLYSKALRLIMAVPIPWSNSKTSEIGLIVNVKQASICLILLAKLCGDPDMASFRSEWENPSFVENVIQGMKKTMICRTFNSIDQSKYATAIITCQTWHCRNEAENVEDYVILNVSKCIDLIETQRNQNGQFIRDRINRPLSAPLLKKLKAFMYQQSGGFASGSLPPGEAEAFLSVMPSFSSVPSRTLTVDLGARKLNVYDELDSIMQRTWNKTAKGVVVSPLTPFMVPKARTPSKREPEIIPMPPPDMSYEIDPKNDLLARLNVANLFTV